MTKLIIFDTETTGVDTETDRIIQFALNLDGQEKQFLVNPGVPIPPEATAVHGITDADVKNAKPFSHYAEKLHRIFKSADLVGFGIARFDIPLLIKEFKRCGIRWEPGGRVIDCLEIFFRFEKRDLTAALKFYCGEEHTDAHDALGDVRATEKVFRAQRKQYWKDCVIPDMLDPSRIGWDGKLERREDGEVILTFGKHRGKTLKAVAKQDLGWLQWASHSVPFCREARRLIQEAIES